MKNLCYILILMVLGCNNQHEQADEHTLPDSSDNAMVDTNSVVEAVDNSKYYTQQDSVLMDIEYCHEVKFSKTEFNALVDFHPEFFEEEIYPPDVAYNKRKGIREYESEVGADYYYGYYTYFLQQRKQKDSIKDHSEKRKKLVQIYLIINGVNKVKHNGGTHFMHMIRRIPAYVEYDIHKGFGKYAYYREYDMTKQKKLYIKSLKQYIADEKSIDFETTEEEKEKRYKYINKSINKLDTLITDYYFFRCAQEFQLKEWH